MNIQILVFTLTVLTHGIYGIESMKIVCITHADFETPGVIQDWAAQHNHQFSIYKPYKGQSCKDVRDFDFLIIMGGPQSACELDKDPYLYDEIALIKYAIAENKLILGFCLGAQLIGQAYGAAAARSPEKEVGVLPIDLTQEGKTDPVFANVFATFDVIHWHNDMPGLTADAQILATSAGCPRQIIKYDKHVYGFQCHMEITKEGIATMIEACPDDLKPSKYTQTVQQLFAHDYDSINRGMIKILDRLISLYAL